MSFWRNLATVATVLVFTTGIHAGEAPTPAQITKAIRELGDESFVAREKASTFLWKAGRAAEPALLQAAKSPELEVAHRAQAILEHFEYGIYPDTPRNIVELVEQFRAGDSKSRPETLKKLLALDGPGYAVVVKIVAAEKELAPRRDYYYLLRAEFPRIAALLLTQGNLDQLEDLLEQLIRQGEAKSGYASDSAIRDYAALLWLRGTLGQKIAKLAAEMEKSREPRTAEILTYLHRANGDLPSASRAAEQVGNHELQRWLLWEQGKWQELIARHPPRTDLKNGNEIEILGYQAAYQRLAGKRDDFEKTIVEIHRYADANKSDSSEVWYTAEALLLNDRPQDAIDVLIRAKQYGSAFELLTSQMRYREAFALAEKVKAQTHKEAFSLHVRRACALYEAGEKDIAMPLFEKMRDFIKDKMDEEWVLAYAIAAEVKFGLKDLAFEHAALVVAQPKYADENYLFHQLLGDKSNGAGRWWRYLRQQKPDEDHQFTLKRVCAIMEGKLDRKELLALVAAAADWIPSPKKLPKDDKGPKKEVANQREEWLTILGESCLAAKLEKEALRFFAKALGVGDSVKPVLRLADYWADKKQHVRAAALCKQAWAIDKRSPTPLFLQGWNLVQAGQVKEGENLMKLAHWLPLANGEARYLLVNELKKRGLGKWSLREWEISARVGELNDWYTCHAQELLGYDAEAKGRYLDAAAGCESSMLRCLNRNTGYLETSSYVRMPNWVHQYRARGLLDAGKFDEALQEIQICLSYQPADIDTPILMTPLLEKNGRKQAADELFTKVFNHRAQLCADYPRWAQQHNDLAWLCARCRRQLDKAADHAQKAVALAPKSAPYASTLAEVHFQRGDQKKAIELMEQCAKLEPARDFYRRQLKRFAAGDRFTDVSEKEK